MIRDILFLLPPGFEADARREYCPECAEVWGLLNYYPALKETLEIRYVGLEHPRGPICALLGEGTWNAPTLVLAPGHRAAQSDVAAGRAYLGSAAAIAAYWRSEHGTAARRSS